LPQKILFRVRDAQKTLPQAIARLREEAPYQPAQWVKTGINACADGYIFLRDLLTHQQIRNSEFAEELEGEIDNLSESLREYQDYLENELLGEAQGEFGVGEERLKIELANSHFLDLTPEELAQFGTRLFDDTQRDIEDLLEGTDYDMGSYLTMLKRKQLTSKQINDFYREYTEKAKRFLQENDLVRMDVEESIQMRNIPAYSNRLYPFAAYRAPTLFGDQNGFFFVNTHAKENMEEHTRPFMRSTVVHESYPGHHLQFSLANILSRDRPSGWVRSLNESSAMYEGWAMYCEQLMIEEGLNKTKGDKFMLLRDRLWRALRVKIDVGFHTQGLSYDSARNQMVQELKFSPETAEADLDWYIEYPGVPLGYATGWKMINLLREYEQDRLGSKFSLPEFNNKVISEGSIALPLVIENAFGKRALKQVYREFREYIK
jgi:uncharacterized protein (DUF885 family)